MPTSEAKLERIRWLLTIAALTAIAIGLFQVLQPFLVSLTWAAILVVTTWPIYRGLLKVVHRRAALAATLMTLLQALVLLAAVVPLLIAAIGEVETFARHISVWLTEDELQIPSEVKSLPVIGYYLSDYLNSVQGEHQRIAGLIREYQSTIFGFATLAAKGVVGAVAKIAMCLFAMFFFYLHGSALGNQISRGLRLVGGERFERLLVAIRGTVRGAVYGVVATAIGQGFLAGLGYVVVGAPTPLLLGFATVIMSLVPFGTPAVYLPVALYLMFSGSLWGGLGLLVWGVAVVSTIDNLLRPYFISQATQMPLLLVFMGVIGGVVSFGLVGLFVGPVLIAVAQALWIEWVEHARTQDPVSRLDSPPLAGPHCS